MQRWRSRLLRSSPIGCIIHLCAQHSGDVAVTGNLISFAAAKPDLFTVFVYLAVLARERNETIERERGREITATISTKKPMMNDGMSTAGESTE